MAKVSTVETYLERFKRAPASAPTKYRTAQFRLEQLQGYLADLESGGLVETFIERESQARGGRVSMEDGAHGYPVLAMKFVGHPLFLVVPRIETEAGFQDGVGGLDVVAGVAVAFTVDRGPADRWVVNSSGIVGSPALSQDAFLSAVLYALAELSED